MAGGLVNPYGTSENFYNALNEYSKALQKNGYNASDIASYNYAKTSLPPFSLSGGTENLYTNMREATPRESIAASINRAGEFLSNLPGELAYITNPGNEEQKQRAKLEWTFNPDKLEQGDVQGQMGNFLLSLPGGILGGPLSGFTKVTDEFLLRNPITESKYENGKWYIPDYKLDTSQSVTSGISGGIDIAGSFFGGTGKVFGSLAKGAAKIGGARAAKALERGFAADAEKEIEKALGNVVKWKGRAEQANRMAEGWVGQAFRKAGHPIEGTLGQIGADALEEAGEETVQSLMDDVRYKTWDENSFERALKSGAMGALGGAAMSSVLTPANHVLATRRARKAAQNAPSPSQAQDLISAHPEVPEGYYTRIQESTEIDDPNEIAPSMRPWIAEQMGGEFNREPGSFSAKVSMSPNNTVRAHQVYIPFRNVEAAWKNNGDAKPGETNGRSRDTLAFAFTTDKRAYKEAKDALDLAKENNNTNDINKAQEEIDRIVKEGQDKLTAIMTNPNRKAAFNEFRDIVRQNALDSETVAKGSFKRYPHTDTDSDMVFDIVDVTDGGVFNFNPGVYTMFNGDLDGDSWTIETDKSRILKGKNVYDMLEGWRPTSVRTSSEGVTQVEEDMKRKGYYRSHGTSKYGWEEAGFTEASKNSEYIRVLFHKHLGEELGEKYFKEYNKAWDKKVDGEAHPEEELAAIFRRIYLATEKDVQKTSELMYEIQMESSRFAALDNALDVLVYTVDTEQSLPENLTGRRSVTRPSPGSLNGKTPIENLITIGWHALIDPNSQGVLRGDQAVNWINKQVQLMNALTNAYHGSSSNKDQWIAEMLHTIDSGENPSEMVEQAFMFSWRIDFFRRLGIISFETETGNYYTANRIGENGISVEEVIRQARISFNETQKIYDNAIKKEGVNGYFTDPNAAFKAPLKEEDGDMPVIRRIRQLVGNFDAKIILDIPEDSRFNAYTVNELVDYISVGKISSSDVRLGNELGKRINDFIDLLSKDMKQEGHARGDSTMRAIDALDGLHDIVKIDDEGNYYVDEQLKNDSAVLIDAIRMLIGRRACARMSFYSDTQMLNSRYAKYFFGKESSQDTRSRAILSIGLGETFYDYIHYMTLRNDEGVLEPDLQMAEKSLYGITGKGNVLVDEIVANLAIDFKLDRGEELTEEEADFVSKRKYTGDEQLRILLDPSINSFDEIYKDFTKMHPTEKFNKGEFLAMALSDPSSSMPGADLSTRIRESQDRSNIIVNKTIFSAVQETEAFISEYQQATQERKQLMIESLKYYALQAADESNNDILAAGIYASTSLTREGPEKAQAFIAYALNYQEGGLLNGYFTGAFLNQLGYATGSISINDAVQMRSIICQALYDSNFKEDIWIGGKLVTISQQKIFKAHGIDIEEGVEPTSTQYLDLFRECPVLLQWTFPIKWMSSSTTDPNLTPTKIMTPVERANYYIDNRLSMEFKRRSTRNAILADFRQDPMFPVVICGIMGDDIVKHADNPRAFMRSCKTAINKAVDEVYYQISLHKDEVSKNNYSRKWRKAAIDDTGHALKRIGRDVITRLNNIANLYSPVNIEDISDSHAIIINSIFRNHINKYLSDKKAPTLDGNSSEDSSEAKILMQQAGETLFNIHRLYAMLDAINDENLASYTDVISEDNLEEARAALQPYYSEKEIDNILNEAIGITHPDSGLYKGVIRSSTSADEAYRIVIDFVSTGETFTDYKNLIPKSVKDVRKAFSDEISKHRFISFWNNQIIKTEYKRALSVYTTETIHDIDMEDQVISWFEDTAKDLVRRGYEGNADISSTHIRPNLKFTEEAMVLADRSSFGISAGGVSTMSGMDAGSYQWMTAIALAPNNHTCDRPPSPVENAAELWDLMKKHNGLLRCRRIDPNTKLPIPYSTNSEGNPVYDFNLDAYKLRDLIFEAIENGEDLNNFVSTFLVYKPHECTDPMCSNHYHPATSYGDGRYNPGRYTLAELLYTLSEARVFKSKKKRNAFDRIFHTARENLSIKYANFSFAFDENTTYEDFVSQYYKHRDAYIIELANYINTVFKQEGISANFGYEAALTLAQVCTPFSRVKLANGKTVVVDNLVLNNEKEFNKRFGIGEDFASISEIEIQECQPISMSLIEVCKKMNHDFTIEIYTNDDIKTGSDLTAEVRERIYKQCYDNWDGVIDDSDEAVKAITSKFPTIVNNMTDRIPTSRAATALQQFSEESGVLHSVHNGKTVEESVGSVSVDILSKQQQQKIISFHKNYNLEKSDYIIKDVISDDLGYRPGDSNKQAFYNGVKGQNIPSNAIFPGKKNVIIVDLDMTKDGNIEKLQELIKKHGASSRSTGNHAILVLSPECASKLRGIDTYKYGFTGQKMPFKFTGMPSEFSLFEVFNPMACFDFREYMGERSQNIPVDPSAVVVSIADWGIFGTGDSGSILYKAFANHVMHLEDHFKLNLNDMFANRHFPSEELGHVELVTDEDEFQHIYGLLNGTDIKSQDVVSIPKQQDKARKVSNDVMIGYMNDFLESTDKREGIIRGNAKNGSVVGFLKTQHRDGTVTYAPIYLNKGGMPFEFTDLSIDRAALTRGSLEFDCVADIKMGDVQTVDAIKEYFPTFAFKTYSTIAADKECPIQLGMEILTQYWKGQSEYYEDVLKIGEIYSGTTEKSRTTEFPELRMYENMIWMRHLIPCSIFSKRDSKGNVEDVGIVDLNDERFNDFTPEEIRQLTNVNDDTLWWEIARGTRSLYKYDYELNVSIRKIVRNILMAGRNPYEVLSNVDIVQRDGKSIPIQQWGTFNWGLFFKDMTINDIMRVFNAMDPRLSFRDKASDWSLYPGKAQPMNQAGAPVPLINSNGDILVNIPSEMLPGGKLSPLGTGEYYDSSRYLTENEEGELSEAVWRGTHKVNINDNATGNFFYVPGHIHVPYFNTDSSLLGLPNASVKHGSQSEINMSLETGLKSKDADNLINYMFSKANPTHMFGPDGTFARMFDPDDEIFDTRYGNASLIDLLPDDFYSKRGITYRAVQKREENLIRDGIRTLTEDLDILIEDDNDLRLINSARDSVRKAMNVDGGSSTYSTALSDESLDRLFREVNLFTSNNHTGKTSVTVKQYVDVMEFIAQNIRENPTGPLIPFPKETNGHLNLTDRPVCTMVDFGLMNEILQTPRYKQIYGKEDGSVDYKRFFEINKEMQLKLNEVIPSQNKDAQNAQFGFIDFLFMTHGDNAYSSFVDYEGNVSQRDWSEAVRNSIDKVNLFSPTFNLDYNLIEEGIKRGQQMLDNEKERDRNSKQSIVKSPNRPGGTTRTWNLLKRNSNFKLSKEMKVLSKVMALLDPELHISAHIQKGVFAYTTKFGMLIQAKTGIGPYDMGARTLYGKENKEALEAFKKSDQARELYKALLTSQWTQDELLTLQQEASSVESIIKLANEKLKNASRLEKIQMGAYKYASGGDSFLSNEMEIWAEDLFQRIQLKDPTGSSYLLQVQKDGRTNYEHMLGENPAGLIMATMTMDENSNPFLIESMQSFQHGKTVEMAAEDAAISIVNDFFAQHSIFDLFFTTGVCRFRAYTWNVNKFFLGSFLPVNLMEYSFNKHLIDKQARYKQVSEEYGIDVDWSILGVDLKNKDFEHFQKRKSWKEALLMDVFTIGVKSVALALMAANAFEPPDDEDLWGNLEEWTIMGNRIGENWWIQDILGPFLAICATWRSGQLGKPRIDILFNWLGNAMYSNPMLKVADVASYLLDPTYDYDLEFENEKNRYANGPDGEPSLMQKWEADVTTYGLHWISQFITPSFVKSFFNAAEPYEHSYKKVYKRNATGSLTDPSETEYTTYLDARIRNISRKNPVLGAMLDILTPNQDTSYYQGGTPFAKYAMPLTLTPDQAQLQHLNKYNIYNADGTEKTDAEKRTVAVQVIAELGKGIEPEDLAKSGFVLNYQTREYVSKEIHDLIEDYSDEYNAWVQETGKDAYVVGDGDWATGQRIISETNQDFYDTIAYYKDIYYKLWDDSIKYGVTYYNRLNTSYARTARGEVYATGFHPSLGPFLTASGSLDDPGNTLGREGNWETESVVIPGESAGGRALIPAVREEIETPSLDSWGKDENGGYSDLRDKNGNIKGLDNSKSDKDSDDTSSGSKRKNNSGSGGGGRSGGSGGSGGGGGRGYYQAPPRISIQSSSNYPISPSRIMSSNRKAEPDDVSYLRPGFETKGSREAYKRGDI